MKGKNEFTLKEAIDLFLTRKNYKKDILPYQVIDAYHQVAGPFISKLTLQVSISDGILFVSLSSAALRHELSLKMSYLIEEINKQVGMEAVRKIVLK